MPARCALGCERRGVHRFPNPDKFPEKFKAWVHIMGGKLETPKDHLPYQHKRICEVHFNEKDYNRNKRLNALAIPSQHLPAWCSLPQPIDSSSASTSCDIQSILEIGELPQTSGLVMPEVLDSFTPSPVCTTKLVSEKVNILQSSSVKKKVVPICEGSISAISNVESVTFASDVPIREGMRSGLPSLEVTKMKALSRQITQLKHEVLRLRKRGLYYKTRLANAVKISDHVAFKQVTKKMTEPAKLFTYMNFREAGKAPKGRRFTLDEKLLSLSIFKRSPKCYTLLSKYFTLPSKKSLKMLISAMLLKRASTK